MPLYKGNKTNTIEIAPDFSIIIDSCKFSPNVINVTTQYKQSYLEENEERFLKFMNKRLKLLISKYFDNYILSVEASYTKLIGCCPIIDLTIKLPQEFDMLQKKREWAKQPDGPVIELFTVMVPYLEKIYDDFEVYNAKDWHCGEKLYKNYDE